MFFGGFERSAGRIGVDFWMRWELSRLVCDSGETQRRGRLRFAAGSRWCAVAPCRGRGRRRGRGRGGVVP